MPSSATAANADVYAWVGPNNGLWSSASNWFDTTSGLNPAPFIPGPLTPVWLLNPAGAETIQGGGTAASIGVTGSVTLAGSYGIGGGLAVGTVTASVPWAATAGALVVSSGGSIGAAALNVADGSFTLGASSSAAFAGGITLGVDGGYRIPNNGTYAYLPSVAGTVAAQAGATLSVGGGLLLNAGTVSASGGTVSITGGMTIGSAAAILSQQPLNTAEAAFGRVLASAGGTIAAQGNVALPDGMLVADGSGSVITVGGTVTASMGGIYVYYTGIFPSTSPGMLAAVNGGGIQVGGLVLNAPSLAPFGETVISADGTSWVEVGTAGGAALGALTIDAGRTVAATAGGGIYANLVDNGTLLVTGGTLVQSGDVSGNGIIQIGRNGTWLLEGSIASSTSIVFADLGAALAVGPEISLSGVTLNAATHLVPTVISGFAAGDALMVSDTVNAAAFTPGTAGSPGTLTLSYNSTVVDRFLLSGTFTGQTFTLSSAGNGWTVVGLSTPVASVPQATSNHTYVWTGGPAASGWQTPGNWRDVAAVAQATVAPGVLTPVMLAGLFNAPAQAITGGGTAASLGVTGAFGLSGSYGIAGTLSVGTVIAGAGLVGAATTLLPGALTLFSDAVLSATTIGLPDGTIALGAGATLSASGNMTIGVAGGQNVLNSSGVYLANPGAAGLLSLTAGATVSATGAVVVSSGSIADVGGTANLGRSLVIGTAGTGTAGGTAGSLFYVAPTPGYVVAGAGGSISVAGGIGIQNGMAVADGLGASLVASGQLSVTGSGSYTDAGIWSLGTWTASVAALNGGFVQATGAILSGGTTATLGIIVDSASTLEIGTLGGAALGALTIDPTRSLTSNGTVCLTDTLINNGTIVVASGTLTQNGSVSGTGVMRIGSGTLVVNGSVTAGETISFATTAAALAIGNAAVWGGPASPYPVAATLSGFQTGNVIIAAGSITSATYTAGTLANTGMLTLRAGSTVVENLLLTGVYTQRSFSVTQAGSNTVIGLVSDAAALGIESLGGGSLTQSGTVWTLDLGSVAQGGAALTGTIGVMNLSSGQVGALRGAFTTSGASSYKNAGFTSGFSGLAAGQEEHQQTITLTTASTGLFTETIVVGASSVSLSDTVVLPSQTIVVRGTVQPAGLLYTLGTTPTTIVAGAGNDIFSATSGALNSRTSLDGGGGTNTLRLVSGGSFDLGAPVQIANVQTVTATEGTIAPIIYMRNGASFAVNLSPAAGGGGSATIYGGTGADVFNLSTGSDTVVLGSANETVIAGGGTAVVQAPIGFAGAAVMGGTAGRTTLEITTGGTATLAAADIRLTVSLDAATNLSLGTAQFVRAIGSAGADTIIAGAAGQTLTGGAGSDVLVGFSGFGDRYVDTSAGLNGDTIVNFGGNDTIDITDLSFGALVGPVVNALGTVTTMTLSNPSHNATITLIGAYSIGNFSFGADGSGGLAIGFVPS